MKPPYILSLDAFGTLYKPRESPLVTYQRFGQQYGIEKPLSLLERDFKKSFKQMGTVYPNYGLGNSHLLREYNKFPLSNLNEIKYSDNWWGLLIEKTFLPNKVPLEMVHLLLAYFSGPAYYVPPEMLKILSFLSSLKLQTVDVHTKDDKPIILINSNGDPRVHLILKHLGLIGPRYIPEDLVYLSYVTSIEKPNEESFEYILKDLIDKGYVTYKRKDQILGNCWHVGDTFETDLKGAINAGWHGVLLGLTKSSYSHPKAHFISSYSDLESLWDLKI